jgi:phage terminase large subunit GpA-like protein
MATEVARIVASRRARLAPPPRLSVADWLDEHRVLPRGYPAPVTGPWRTDRTPYLREPFDAFADPEVETIVLMFSSQIAKTEFLLGTLGYAYKVDPAPGMLVLPTLDVMGKFSKDRLMPTLRGIASLKMGEHKSRESDGAIFHKRVNGATLVSGAANSPAGLSSYPVQNLWCDEIDRWPATTPEGDPLFLAFQRTEAFRRRKIILTSTPTIKGASRIEDWYERSDMRVLDVPCCNCGAFFEVKWKHIRWESGRPETAHIECPDCGAHISDAERTVAVSKARWRPTAPDVKRIRGYRTWSVVSPFKSLEDLVRKFIAAKGESGKLQTFVNLTLGESWELPSVKVETSELQARRELYAAEVPAGVKVLTCGVDTQDDRLESLVIGWGDGEESWVISRESHYGDPQTPAVWGELDGTLNRDWPCEGGGTMRVQCALVDALGHRTEHVYREVAPRQGRRVYASIGKDGGDSGQVVSQPKPLETRYGNVLRHIVDASQVKALIYARLRESGADGLPLTSGPGVVHFPMTVGDVFFDELTAEHQVIETSKHGVEKLAWAMRRGRRRNESLDCFGLALAALRVVCPTPTKFDELAAKVSASRRSVPVAAPQATRQARTKGSSYLS